MGEALEKGRFRKLFLFRKTLSENVWCTRKFQGGEIVLFTAAGRGKRNTCPVLCVLLVLSGLNSCNSSSYDGIIHSAIPPMITG